MSIYYPSTTTTTNTLILSQQIFPCGNVFRPELVGHDCASELELRLQSVTQLERDVKDMLLTREVIKDESA